MNITLNSLPTLTWNRLNMNKSTVTVDGTFAPHVPTAVLNGQEVLWDPQADWQDFGSAYGLSPDLTALTGGCPAALVETRPGQVMDRPIVLTYAYAPGERAASRLILHAEKGSTLSCVLLLTSPDDSRDTSALQIVVEAEQDAQVDLYAAQLLGRGSVCLNEVGGTLAENAKVRTLRLELGSTRAYSGVDLDLAGAHSSFESQVGYYARSYQLFDMNYVALHHGPHTESRMEAAGTLEDGARKLFRGTIDFQRGCKGAVGNENENVLLLGENMVNQTIPLILCKEEDVEGNHGASIGQLDERMLFYLGTRGIAPHQAQQIIARSRIQSVCDKIPDEAVRSAVEAFENREVASDGTELPL